MEPRLQDPHRGGDGLRVHEQRLRQGGTPTREIASPQALASGGLGVLGRRVVAGDDADDGIGPVRGVVHVLTSVGVVSDGGIQVLCHTRLGESRRYGNSRAIALDGVRGAVSTV
jgi:hypothetical protein